MRYWPWVLGMVGGLGLLLSIAWLVFREQRAGGHRRGGTAAGRGRSAAHHGDGRGRGVGPARLDHRDHREAADQTFKLKGRVR